MRPEIILAFDTAAAHCAAAVLWGEGLVVQRVETCVEVMAKGQAERLVPMIEGFMAGHAVGWGDLTSIAVGVGPGNFTGVRISVALARGLALGRGIPAVGVTGFEVLGAGAAWAVIDAPRGQVYVQGAGAARVMGADEVAGLDEPVRRMSDLSPAELAGRIAEVGFVKARVPQPRPAPFYLRGAEALPSTDPPVVILP